VSLRDSFSVLRDANFRWFYIAVIPNQTAWSMTAVGLPFAVLHVDDSPKAIGFVAAANTIAGLVMFLVGGVVSDRVNRTLVLRGARFAGGVAQSIAATLVITGRAEIWMLVVTEAIVGVAVGMSMPAVQGLVPELAGREHLQQANALMSMSRGAVNIVGPSVAALLVATVGGGWALAAAAVMFFVSSALVSFVRLPVREKREGRSAFADLHEGWTLFRTTSWFWVVVSGFMVLNAIYDGSTTVLAPYVAKHTIGVRSWGFALSAEAVGLLLVTFVLLRIRIRYPLRMFMFSCFPLVLPMLILGIAPHAWLLVPAMAVVGACFEIGAMGWNLAMQENVPAEMMSRAYSYDALGSFLAMPVGQLTYGPLAESIGYRQMLVGSGIVYVALGLVILAVPAVYNLRRVDPVEPDGAPATA
jgi:MFS family permease